MYILLGRVVKNMYIYIFDKYLHKTVIAIYLKCSYGPSRGVDIIGLVI